MENGIQEQEEVVTQVEQKSRLHQVTPLSKYLAMALFVTLPFIGGWIGYTYAPVKVVEVERVVIQETEERFERLDVNVLENDTASSKSIIFPNSKELSLELPAGWSYIRPNVYDSEGRIVFSLSYPIREVGYEPLDELNVREITIPSGLEFTVVDRVERADRTVGFAHYMNGVKRDWDGDFLQDSFEIMVRYSDEGQYVSGDGQPGELIETRYKTYAEYLEEEEFIQRIIERIVEVPVLSVSENDNGNLLNNFNMTETTNGEYQMGWSVNDSVLRAYTDSDNTYIMFALVPVGLNFDYKNSNGVSQSIGDGFNLESSSYTFSSKYYEENFSWPLNWGESYQVVGKLAYQPSEFECDPQYSGECVPVYSDEDSQLIQSADDYNFVSEPFILE